MHVYMVLQIGFARSTISSAELGDRAHPIGSMNSAFLFREPDSEESGAHPEGLGLSTFWFVGLRKN